MQLKMYLKIIFLILIYLNISSGAELTNMQGLGMARTFTAVAKGINALNINPANLALPDKKLLNFNLLNFTVISGSDLIDIDLYNKYFTGDENGEPVYLYDADKRKIINSFPSGLAQTGSSININLFALSLNFERLGGFALNINEQAALNLILPKSYLEFILYGNPLNSKYDFSRTYFNAMWYREYSISYAREIPAPDFLKYLAAGISLKLIHGYGFAEVSHNRTYLTTDSESKISGRIDYQIKLSGLNLFKDEDNSKYIPFPAPAGTGIGFDIGLNAKITEELIVGVALVDVGRINWKRNTYEHAGFTEFNFDDPKTGQEQLDSIDNLIKSTIKPISSFNSALPTILRLGVAYRLDKAPFIKNFPGEMLLAFDYNQGFNNIACNSTKPRFSFGVEYKPWKWLPIRTGISAGGIQGFNWAFGTGIILSFLDIEFATENIEAALFPSTLDRISFGFGLKVKI